MATKKISLLTLTSIAIAEKFRIIKDNSNENITVKPTHTSWGSVNGSYNIPDDQVAAFQKAYYNDILRQTRLCLIEQHREIGPVIIDLDFKFDGTSLERRFTYEHIHRIAKLYIDEIDRCFTIADKMNQLTAYVFLRDDPYFSDKDGLVKDGIHIMFPHIVSEPEIQFMIREHVIAKCASEKILKDVPELKDADELDKIFDKSVIKNNGWIMYGSAKPKCRSYKLKYIFDNNLDPIPFTVSKKGIEQIDLFGMPDIATFFSIRRFNYEDCCPIKNEILGELDNRIKKRTAYDINILKQKNRYNQNARYDIKQIASLMDILSDERADDYKQWREAGWCLYNIDSKNIDILNIWIEFSKRSPKFKAGKCEQDWFHGGFRQNGSQLRIGSLHHWAREDDRAKYDEIIRQDIKHYINMSYSGAPLDVANVLFQMFQHRYKFASRRYKTWYEFYDHRWHEDDDGISLMLRIIHDLIKEYVMILEDYNKMIIDINNNSNISAEEQEQEAKKLEDKMKIVTGIIRNLKEPGFQDKIMKECQLLFYDKSFINKLDTNVYLVGCENGVYDLQTGTYREGQPDDCISMNTGNDYEEYDPHSEKVEAIMKFIGQVLPNYNVREYVLKLLASMLQGFNKEEKFRIWTGTGGNGKSKLWELFALATGEYCDKFDISLLTGKRASSNAATPEMAKSKGKRAMSLDEPEGGANINVGLMKEMTGGDKIVARPLYKDIITFKPQFKLVLLCNDLPAVPPQDGGVWRRLEVVEFTSRFVDTPREENEYERDENLSEKLQQWKQTFLSILFHYHKIYTKEKKLVAPIEVTKYTQEYQKNSDQNVEFINATLKKSGVNSTVNIADIYREYLIWWEDNNKGVQGRRVFGKKELKTYLEKLYGKKNIIGDIIRGYKLISDQSSNAGVSDMEKIEGDVAETFVGTFSDNTVDAVETVDDNEEAMAEATMVARNIKMVVINKENGAVSDNESDDGDE